MQSFSEFRSTNTAELPSDALGRGVGFVSLGLAAAQLAVPRTLLRTVGIRPSTPAAAIVRAIGLAKLGLGLGILIGPRRRLPLLVRAAIDVVDLGLVSLAGRTRSNPRRLFGAAAVAGVGAINTIAAVKAQKAFAEANEIVMYSVTINKPIHEVYAFFRRFERLPTFMEHLAEVRELDDRRSHWVARLPLGRTVEWDAEITVDRPGEAIAWQSTADSRVQTSGRVMFETAPGSSLTEVRVEMKLGTAGHESSLLAKLFAKPQLKGDLRRLKQVLETGEVLFSDASAHKGKHPAQPDPNIDRRPRIFIENAPTAVKGVTP
jgi:uncharacterized membrane protein